MMTLPGIVGAEENDTQEYIFNIGYRYHDYREDSLAASNVKGNQLDRYNISSNQFHLDVEWLDMAEISLNLQRETMAGASPWFTAKDASGKVIQVMSGASIQDTRTEVNLNGKYIHATGRYGFTVNQSDENDYDSLSFGAEYERDFNKKLTTFSIAADFSIDDIEPTDSDVFPTRPVVESKHSASMFLSLSQVINRHSIAQISFGYTKKEGFLSDPYKLVQVDSDLIADSRPSEKTSKTISVKYRYFIDELDAAFHTDYRHYWDDWKVKSHTISINYVQPIAWNITIKPGIRFYNQKASFFYQDFYDKPRVDNLYSTDYRLSEFGTITYSLDLTRPFGDVTAHLTLQKYQSGGSKGFANANVENPALLDFTLISLGFDYKF